MNRISLDELATSTPSPRACSATRATTDAGMSSMLYVPCASYGTTTCSPRASAARAVALTHIWREQPADYDPTYSVGLEHLGQRPAHGRRHRESEKPVARARSLRKASHRGSKGKASGPDDLCNEIGTVVDRSGGLVDDRLMLRAFREEDLSFLDRLSTDPDALGPLEWTRFSDVRTQRRRWEQDGYVGAESALAAVLADGTIAGIASWQPKSGGVCYEIGLALLPEHRGRGLGTAGQRLLVDHLFGHTTVHRLEALTDSDNVAEQRSLERIGFEREGVLRGRYFQRGDYRDLVIYALLRDSTQLRPMP